MDHRRIFNYGFGLVLFLYLAKAISETPSSRERPLVYFYNISKHSESYEEQVLLFTFQGLVNRRQEDGLLMYDASFLNFDWPDADRWWRSQLNESKRAIFQDIEENNDNNLCDLIQAFNRTDIIHGTVLYPSASSSGDGYTLSMALNLAAQNQLLPITPNLRTAYVCLDVLPIRKDLTTMPEVQNRSAAWAWAVRTLLPRSNRSMVYNMYHFDPRALTDPQSNATVANLDYAIQQRAFVVDLKPDDVDDLNMLTNIFDQLDDLFDAFGWAHDEHAWTRAVSVAGGVVFCSFASPNLSLWARFPLLTSSPRRLPDADSGAPLDPSKYYVTFETNEGDTPRIVVSAFGASWANPNRGSVPVAWSVDPVLFERFPALMDWYARTATANDSFIGGVAGGGYVYLGALTDAQLQRYAMRVGRLFASYGPTVVDTYGQANFSVIERYSEYAAQGGAAPQAYVAQPLWAHGSYAEDAWRCPELNIASPSDGTPIVCTSADPSLFYRNRGLNKDDPARDLAARIRNVSTRYEPPFFVTVYGGLNWQPGSTGGKTEFWTLLRATMDDLGSDYRAIGANEMARLAFEKCSLVNTTTANKTFSCAKRKR